MWKSVPVLVQLRENVSFFLDQVLEEGGEADYVTINRLIDLYNNTYHSKHHLDQIRDALKDNVKGEFIWRVVFSDGDPDNEVCMGCGNPDKHGYRDAFQYVKLRGLTRCPYNLGCECR